VNADTPTPGLRLLAVLIAADLRAGSPALATSLPEPRDGAPRRGRKTARVVAVAYHRMTAHAA
jgi:hypothetical protein